LSGHETPIQSDKSENCLRPCIITFLAENSLWSPLILVSNYLLARSSLRPGALKLPAEDITAAVQKHARGDWGELDFEDSQLNDLRLQDGGPIASIYIASNGVKFYVLTESDRSVTTLLLPEEY
jgi:hypothetical protein